MARGSFFSKKKKKDSLNKNKKNFDIAIGEDLEKNLEDIKTMLDSPDDLIVRQVSKDNHLYAIVYISGLVEMDFVQNNILKNLQTNTREFPDKANSLLDLFYQEMIAITEIKKAKSLDNISYAILSGNSVLFVDGIDSVLIMGTAGGEKRKIQEPISESLIRGPREGFVESINTNTVILRRYLRDPNLRFKTYETGRRSKQKLVLSYVTGIVNPEIVKEVNRRLETIDLDTLPESGYVEQWIEDSFLSPFPQLLNTERPDKVAAALNQGKVAILLDGTPFVLIAPVTLSDTLQSPEDYYERWSVSSLIRILRFFGVSISLFLPALYIALVSYQPGMIPTKLTFSIAATREGVPFPAVIEAIAMGVTMELLREAGARLPQSIGQTIGIVGGLVIGEAAVQAGVVSPIMVIVVALTAIASFTYPSYSTAIAFRVIRFGLMVAAGIFGLYGIILFYIGIMIHMVNLKSFGIPYSTPFTPSFMDDFKDLVIRAPITMLKKRPLYMKPKDEIRIDKEGEE
ncbi:spore germination protein [Virgibacillus sp. SK37]|uniref:spore germination protein n=1 Tax=Virgibacillus sp. SK37 TaxID=403957 RepID=UPI0004D0D336|nr:spore germination protein [Virgibacillus sp. SK37]AIF42430.1 spore germination protein [Virgibacillus sp. SK37]